MLKITIYFKEEYFKGINIFRNTSFFPLKENGIHQNEIYLSISNNTSRI